MSQPPNPKLILHAKTIGFALLGITLILTAMANVGLGRLTFGIFGLVDIAYACYLHYQARRMS